MRSALLTRKLHATYIHAQATQDMLLVLLLHFCGQLGGLTSLQLTNYLKIDPSPLGHVNLKIELE